MSDKAINSQANQDVEKTNIPEEKLDEVSGGFFANLNNDFIAEKKTPSTLEEWQKTWNAGGNPTGPDGELEN